MGDNEASADAFVCSGRRFMKLGKWCCAERNVLQKNLHTWFKAEAKLGSLNNGVATVLLTLLFRDIREKVAWKALRWEDLGQMHGRRVHVSVVSSDLRFAWHVHPDDSGEELPADWTALPVRLRLPEDSPALAVRLHLSFGVRAWAPAVNLCIGSVRRAVDMRRAVRVRVGAGGAGAVRVRTTGDRRPRSAQAAGSGSVAVRRGSLTPRSARAGGRRAH